MLYGTDPEFFSINEQGFVISPALLMLDNEIYQIGGDIKHPIFIEEKEYSWMMDGVAWELTVKKPLTNAKEMKGILELSLEHLENLFYGLRYKGEKLSLYRKPVVKINPKDYLKFLDDEQVYQGFIFGCDPDEDACETEYKCETVDVFSHQFRYGGGHLHFSGEDLFYEFPRVTAQLFAITVGNFCLTKSPFVEEEKLRATTYGKPGRFRSQIYPGGIKGIEYRTPSNSWTSLSEEEIGEILNYGLKVQEFMHKNYKNVISNLLPPTISAIQNADIDLATNILKELENF